MITKKQKKEAEILFRESLHPIIEKIKVVYDTDTYEWNRCVDSIWWNYGRLKDEYKPIYLKVLIDERVYTGDEIESILFTADYIRGYFKDRPEKIIEGLGYCIQPVGNISLFKKIFFPEEKGEKENDV